MTCLVLLRKHEDSRANIYPIRLLRFITFLDRANTQDQLFRLASPKLEDRYSDLRVKFPAWMRGFLDTGKMASMMAYRVTIHPLLRDGLARPVASSWQGITIRGVMQ